MTAIIADDEQLSRTLMRRLLEQEEVEILAEVENGTEALLQCEKLRPDLLFCDIRMPDVNGLETAAALTQFEHPPLLVFVTGYSEHAAEAFERAAFDYILKPVQVERLRLTLERSANRIQTQSPEKVYPSLKRLPIRMDYAIRLIKVEDILGATTQQKRVIVHTANQEYKTNYTLTQLEQMLPDEDFMRIHASAIVRLSEVQEIMFLGNHTYEARLSNGVLVPLGRSQYPELQKRLGL